MPIKRQLHPHAVPETMGTKLGVNAEAPKYGITVCVRAAPIPHNLDEQQTNLVRSLNTHADIKR